MINFIKIVKVVQIDFVLTADQRRRHRQNKARSLKGRVPLFSLAHRQERNAVMKK
jgi:hypothetical protein